MLCRRMHAEEGRCVGLLRSEHPKVWANWLLRAANILSHPIALKTPNTKTRPTNLASEPSDRGTTRPLAKNDADGSDNASKRQRRRSERDERMANASMALKYRWAAHMTPKMISTVAG
eukprot:CAMPEP_0183743328 /NCGR_PEP_ID=MMETSP0737-20130205/65161_1 /TAXON_ID=385413 /ORGANISM="Thalassiosira miniscula, Strain CCMP1093" /LENGTH=117 /DNA_ID=CAMNT_0025978945 /DNA_START=1331 /DNA_END=1684 /DNA_ORIENTATION=+